MDQSTLNLELIEALGCSASTGRISFVDNDGVVRVVVENLRQIERLLQGTGLDTWIAGLHRKSFSIPLSEAEPEPHFISFEKSAGSHIVMTNSPHTDGDVRVLDLRVAAIADGAIQARPYRSYFAAVEIFRESGGNQSMFQPGPVPARLPVPAGRLLRGRQHRRDRPAGRSALRRVIIEFARRLCDLQYQPDLVQAKLLQPDRTVYLATILQELGDSVQSVSLADYLDKLRDIFSYLQGSNIEERTKFQHNFNPGTRGLIYRVQLSRSNLTDLPGLQPPDSDYVVEVYRKPPGHRREEQLGRKLCSAADGEQTFLAECQQYLNGLYTEAGLVRSHFELAPFHKQDGSRTMPYVDLRYVTILRTRDDQPLVMTHWRIRHDQNGNPLPRDRYIDRLQFWNRDGQFVCFEEGRDFRAGIEQVKDISKGVMVCAHQLDSRSLPTLTRQLADCGVRLQYDDKV